MAVIITRDLVSSKNHDFIRFRVSAEKDGVSVPVKEITISTSAIAEGVTNISNEIAKATAKAEARLANMVAAMSELEEL